MILPIAGNLLGGGIALHGICRKGDHRKVQIAAGLALAGASLLALFKQAKASSAHMEAKRLIPLQQAQMKVPCAGIGEGAALPMLTDYEVELPGYVQLMNPPAGGFRVPAELADVRFVSLEVDTLTPEIWNSLNQFPNLEMLELSGVDRIQLAGMKPLPHLKALGIDGGKATLFSQLPGLNRLSRLGIAHHSAATLEAILEQTTEIRELVLSGITGLEVEVARLLPHIEQLEALNFDWFTFGEAVSDTSSTWVNPRALSEEAVGTLFQRATRLRSVSFYQIHEMKSEMLQRMLSHLSAPIEEISFGRLDILGDQTLVFDVLAEKRVARLDLFNVGGWDLAELPRISTLRELELSSEDNFKGIRRLFAEMGQLEKVRISFPPISIPHERVLKWVKKSLKLQDFRLTSGVNYGSPFVDVLRP